MTREQSKQQVLFNQVKTVSDSYGAQIALIQRGQLGATCEALFTFLPGQSADYDRWIVSSSSSQTQQQQVVQQDNATGTRSNLMLKR